jgi:acyl carrier protein
MNDEISRILRLLEEGKISADEAERLIRSLKEGLGKGPGPSDKRWKCEGKAEPPDVVRSIVRAFKAAARRHRRSTWWRYYWFAQKLTEARQRRKAAATAEARVHHLFTHCGLADPGDLPNATTLADLAFDDMARDVLRFAIEDEFGVTVTSDDVSAFQTVGDVVAWASERVPAAPAAPAPEAAEPQAGSPEPTVAPEPPRAPEPPESASD